MLASTYTGKAAKLVCAISGFSDSQHRLVGKSAGRGGNIAQVYGLLSSGKNSRYIFPIFILDRSGWTLFDSNMNPIWGSSPCFGTMDSRRCFFISSNFWVFQKLRTKNFFVEKHVVRVDPGKRQGAREKHYGDETQMIEMPRGWAIRKWCGNLTPFKTTSTMERPHKNAQVKTRAI